MLSKNRIKNIILQFKYSRKFKTMCMSFRSFDVGVKYFAFYEIHRIEKMCRVFCLVWQATTNE